MLTGVPIIMQCIIIGSKLCSNKIVQLFTSGAG